MRKPLPSRDELARTFRYDAESGLLYWRERTDARPQWNARLAGKVAGTTCGGRVTVALKGYKRLMAHRVIWKIVHGDEPESIDHIDLNPLNNCLSNLRAATQSQNLGNMRGRSSSGFKGVHLHPASGLWRARICSRTLGYFKTPEQAAAAYANAAREHFGEFARLV